MSICKPENLTTLSEKNKSILGLDIGTKSIGISISDTRLIIASPLKLIKRKKYSDDARELLKIIDKNSIGGLVVGLPIELSGKEGRQAQSIRTFVSNLMEIINIPTTFWDERFSTSVIQRIMIEEADLTRKKRSKVIDKLSAVYILQGYLDYLSNSKHMK